MRGGESERVTRHSEQAANKIASTSQNTLLATSKDTNEPSTWLGEMTAPADHPAKPDKHSPNSALSSAAGCQRQPKRAKKCQSNDAEASTPRHPRRPRGRHRKPSKKGLPTISPQEAPGQGRRRRRISEAPGGLRGAARRGWERGGEGEFSGQFAAAGQANASAAQGQAVEALPLRDLRQALLLAPGLARALGGAHEGRGRRRGAAPRRGEGPRSSPQKGRERRRRAGAAAAPAAAGPRDQRRLRSLRPAAFG